VYFRTVGVCNRKYRQLKQCELLLSDLAFGFVPPFAFIVKWDTSFYRVLLRSAFRSSLFGKRVNRNPPPQSPVQPAATVTHYYYYYYYYYYNIVSGFCILIHTVNWSTAKLTHKGTKLKGKVEIWTCGLDASFEGPVTYIAFQKKPFSTVFHFI
jgi:hypothetical protein